MITNAEQFRQTICRIEATSENLRQAGCGVFLSPSRVLTVSGLVVGKKDHKITSVQQTDTGMRTIHTGMKPRSEGGRHFVEQSLGLAIIELRAPTGEEFASAARRPYAGNLGTVSGKMGTMQQDGKTTLHTLTMDAIENAFSAFKKDPLVSFQCDAELTPGVSGSPIVNKNFELVSVVYGANPRQREMAERFNDVLSPSTRSAMLPLLGPAPDRVTEWIQKVGNELGLRL